MRLHELTRAQWIPRPLDRVFPFFERPENLALITPDWLGFRLLSPTPTEMRQGQLIDYRIRIHGFPVHWRTLIDDYDPPLRFVDEQLMGPYRYWRHLHGFESRGQGTRITDQVQYALPEWLPRMAERETHRLFVRPALDKIFEYRADMFERLFGTRHQGEDQP